MPERAERSRVARRLAVFGPAAIVLIVGALSFGALRRSLNTRTAVLHSHHVLDAASSLLAALLEGESAMRGYALSRDSTLLDTYRTVPVRADSLVVRLRDLTRDNLGQQARIDTLG